MYLVGTFRLVLDQLIASAVNCFQTPPPVSGPISHHQLNAPGNAARRRLLERDGSRAWGAPTRTTATTESLFPVSNGGTSIRPADTRRHIASQHCLPIPLHCLWAAPLVDPVVGSALTGSGSASSFRPTPPWNQFHDEKARPTIMEVAIPSPLARTCFL